MHCYICDTQGRATPAVAICQNCGVGLCRAHHDEDMLVPGPAGLVRRGCAHQPIHVARRRRAADPSRPVHAPDMPGETRPTATA